MVRENPEIVRQSQLARGDDPAIVDQILEADTLRRSTLGEFESLRARQKSIGKDVAKAKGEERAALLEQTKTLAAEVMRLQTVAEEASATLETLVFKVANIIDQAPAGGEEDFIVLRHEGESRDFTAEGFEPRDHLALGEILGAIDTERGAKVSGSRFYYLTGVGARLELALLNMAVDQAISAGFTPMITPTIVNPNIMRGTGFLGEHADEIYYLEADDQYLVGTSEVALAGYHSDEIIDLENGPKRYAGWSACYRREAGSHGRDVRGIIRVHQFHKVEMFSYCKIEDADAEHARLLGWEEEMLKKCELPYRVIDTAAGDLGSSAARKFDCEAWLPTQERYLELTSTSNCTTYQARRLNIRERAEVDGKSETRTVATLNGTLATTRWIVAILENHQQPDGSVRVPKGLQPYLGGLEVLEAIA